MVGFLVVTAQRIHASSMHPYHSIAWNFQRFARNHAFSLSKLLINMNTVRRTYFKSIKKKLYCYRKLEILSFLCLRCLKWWKNWNSKITPLVMRTSPCVRLSVCENQNFSTAKSRSAFWICRLTHFKPFYCFLAGSTLSWSNNLPNFKSLGQAWSSAFQW